MELGAQPHVLDAVSALVRELPYWGYHTWQITPLENWGHHLDAVNAMSG